MATKLTKEEVLHVAHLARLALTEEEIEKFRSQLKTLLDDIKKIEKITDYDEEMMFTPITQTASLREDVVEEVEKTAEILKNVPSKNGNFVEVPVMIDA